MEIVITPETLREKLKIFQNLALRGKTDAHNAENLRFETAADERLHVYGTDLDVNIHTEIEPEALQVVKPGAMVVNGEKIISVLGTLDSKVKSLRLRQEANGWASMLFGRSHFKIAGILPEGFPAISCRAAEEVSRVSLPAGLLLQFLYSTGFAVSTQDTKYTLTGQNLVIDENGSRMVGTDGFRIAVIESKLGGDLTALIPKRGGAVLSKVLAEVEPDTPVTLSTDSSFIYATVGINEIGFLKLAANFPDVTKAIPQTLDYRVLFDLPDLRSALRRADMFAQRDAYSPISFTIRPGEVELSSRSFEVGSGTEIIDAVYEGEEKQLKLTSKYILDFFNSVGESQVTLALQFSDDVKIPTVWTVHRDGAPDVGFDYKCVITRLQ